MSHSDALVIAQIPSLTLLFTVSCRSRPFRRRFRQFFVLMSPNTRSQEKAKRSGKHWDLRTQLLYQNYLAGHEMKPTQLLLLSCVPRQTKIDWKKVILHYGMTPIEWREYEKKRKALLKLPDTEATGKVSAASVVELKTLVDTRPDLYLDQLQHELYVRTGDLISLATVWNIIHKNFGYTLQALGTMAKAQDAGARVAYLDSLNGLTEDPKMFVFVDETAKDRNSCRRRMGWARRGRGLHYRCDYESWRDKRYTFIAAMDINGFVYEASSVVYRKKGQDDADEGAGTIDRERFEYYVETVLVPTLGRYDMGQPRSIVVMDNSPNHVGPDTRRLIESAGALLLYTAPNSPDLSPIEPCFHVYKSALKRTRDEPDIKTVEAAHLYAVQAVTAKIARSEYRHLNGAIRNVPSEDDEEMKRMEIEEEEEVLSAVSTALLFSGIVHI